MKHFIILLLPCTELWNADGKKEGEVFFKNIGYNKIIEKCTRFIDLLS